MQTKLSLKLFPHEFANHDILREKIAESASIQPNALTGFYIVKKSIDARSKQPFINLTIHAFINEPFINNSHKKIIFKDVHQAKNTALITGAGPAGLFAALKFIEHDIKPIIIERGKDVRSRRRDLASLNKQGILN